MNKENVILGFSIGFFILATISFFVDISTQILTVLSLSSLLFSFAQIFENRLLIKDEERKTQLDTLNQSKGLNLSNETLSFLKKYHQELFPSPKVRNNQIIVKILECISISILVIGLSIPVQIFENESIARASTIGAFGFMFLNMCQIEKSRKKSQDLEYIQLFSKIPERSNLNILQENGEDTSDGQP